MGPSREGKSTLANAMQRVMAEQHSSSPPLRPRPSPSSLPHYLEGERFFPISHEVEALSPLSSHSSQGEAEGAWMWVTAAPSSPYERGEGESGGDKSGEGGGEEDSCRTLVVVDTSEAAKVVRCPRLASRPLPCLGNPVVLHTSPFFLNPFLILPLTIV